MSEYDDREPGPYPPPGEGPLAFDPRDPSGRGAGRPPTTLIISALVLLVLVLGLLFFLYRQGPRQAGQPPVVGQPLSDIRQPAPSSAQPTDEAAGLQIYGAGQPPPASAEPGFAPPPEEPLPRSAAPAAQAQPPVAAAPVQPATAPAAQAAAAPTLRPAGPAPAPAAPAPAPPTPAPTAAIAAPGAAVVQIGAYSSAALADKGWRDVAKLLPGQMAGKTKRVEPVLKGAETLYRAAVGGFGSKVEAAGFCNDLKAAGHDCMVK